MIVRFPRCLCLPLALLLLAAPVGAMAQSTLRSLSETDVVANPPRGILQSTGGVVATTKSGGTYRVTGITRQQSGIGQTTTWVEIAPDSDPGASPLGWVPYSGDGTDFLLSDPPKTRSVGPARSRKTGGDRCPVRPGHIVHHDPFDPGVGTMTAFLSSNLFLITILPALCFGFGVLLSDILRLHQAKRVALYGMAIPVGLVVVPLMVNSSMVVQPMVLENGTPFIDKKFAFLDNEMNYMMFAGILMFMGTSVPPLFQELRNRHGKAPPQQQPGE